MTSLKFAERVLLSLGALLLVGLVTSPLIVLWWAGTVTAIVIRVGTALLLWRWIRNYVEEQHGDFLNVLRDLRANLPIGRRGLQLKSRRPADSFGQIADNLNQLVDEAADQITQQLQINRDLEQNKTLFQSILGTMIEGVLVLDSQRRVLYFNDAARRVLDCHARNVSGRPVWEVVRASDLEEIVEDVFETGADFRKEVEFKRSKSVVEVTAAKLPLQPEPGLVLVLHEVTELRRLEHMRREFVSNVSHELKTPLTSIQAYADTLMEGGLEDEENSRLFLSRILEQSDRLQHLIQDMLRLARIESQSEAFLLKPIPLKDALEKCVESRQTVARSRNVELHLAHGVPAVNVLAESSGLQTIIDNLVSNGLNYTREGGRVDVSSRLEGDQVLIIVEDNGIGIAHEHLERIFERFYRVDKARTRGLGGTGLGLAIVKHLANVFHGDIEVDSEVGRGSRFIVRLPVLKEPVQSLQPSEGRK
ncbi:sensor histidine kinase [Planctomicrobium piriforme]|uniref:histidine kinase n=1 Tax=Planctomicrobium piriforme TaxID=1576369 RepID=A0A1I3BHM9_9PLAN|nr:ATP-binding protein [Planctomicrobium piriforme]SFH61449.1 two-component system, OmpR family, phosphate regulon sensor histidine kinase PhoR [Planctomicrobium piriforme]